MKKSRIALALLWVASLFAISFYGGFISYGLFAFLTMVPVVSLLYLLLVLSRFKLYQHFEAPRLISNHRVPFYYTLQNEDLFAFAGARVLFFGDFSAVEGAQDEPEYALTAHSKIRRDTTLLCRYRGEYEVGIRAVELRDYLGLFRLTYKNREAKKAVVFPDIIELEYLKTADLELVSQRDNPRAAGQNDITVRGYIPGDDLRRIHWKQSAKAGELVVRNRIGIEKNGAAILISPRRMQKKPEEYLPVENRMLEIALALALFLIKKRIPVSVFYEENGTVEKELHTPEDFQSFYEGTPGIAFRELPDDGMFTGSLLYRGEVLSKQIVFLISADPDGPTLSFASRLSGEGVRTLVYHVSNAPETDIAQICPHATVCRIPADRALSEVL